MQLFVVGTEGDMKQLENDFVDGKIHRLSFSQPLLQSQYGRGMWRTGLKYSFIRTHLFLVVLFL